MVPFPTSPLRTVLTRFPGTRLSSILIHETRLQVGLPACIASWHWGQTIRVFRLRADIICMPSRFFLSTLGFEVFESANMVNFDIPSGSTNLTFIRQEPFN